MMRPQARGPPRSEAASLSTLVFGPDVPLIARAVTRYCAASTEDHAVVLPQTTGLRVVPMGLHSRTHTDTEVAAAVTETKVSCY